MRSKIEEFIFKNFILTKILITKLAAKIGGWLGIINGSSIISVTELFILFSIFVFKMVLGTAD
jgi:hypothetical protein